MTITVQAAHMLLHLSSLLGNLGLFFYPWFNEALETGCSCQQGCQQETQLWERAVNSGAGRKEWSCCSQLSSRLSHDGYRRQAPSAGQLAPESS